jgi:hypothetical protein
MIDLEPVDSSNVSGVGYDPDSQTLHVEFKGGSRYEYAGVPPETHAELMKADSIGRHLHGRIKGIHSHKRVA